MPQRNEKNSLPACPESCFFFFYKKIFLFLMTFVFFLDPVIR